MRGVLFIPFTCFTQPPTHLPYRASVYRVPALICLLIRESENREKSPFKMYFLTLSGKHWFLYFIVFLKNARAFFSELTLQTRIIGYLLERLLMLSMRSTGCWEPVGCRAVSEVADEWKVVVILELPFTVTEGFCARRGDRDQSPGSNTTFTGCSPIAWCRVLMHSGTLFRKFKFPAQCLRSELEWWSFWLKPAAVPVRCPPWTSVLAAPDWWLRETQPCAFQKTRDSAYHLQSPLSPPLGVVHEAASASPRTLILSMLTHSVCKRGSNVNRVWEVSEWTTVNRFCPRGLLSPGYV